MKDEIMESRDSKDLVDTEKQKYYMILISFFTKQKQTHKFRELTYGCQGWGEGRRVVKNS